MSIPYSYGTEYPNRHTVPINRDEVPTSLANEPLFSTKAIEGESEFFQKVFSKHFHRSSSDLKSLLLDRTITHLLSMSKTENLRHIKEALKKLMPDGGLHQNLVREPTRFKSFSEYSERIRTLEAHATALEVLREGLEIVLTRWFFSGDLEARFVNNEQNRRLERHEPIYVNDQPIQQTDRQGNHLVRLNPILRWEVWVAAIKNLIAAVKYAIVSRSNEEGYLSSNPAKEALSLLNPIKEQIEQIESVISIERNFFQRPYSVAQPSGPLSNERRE